MSSPRRGSRLTPSKLGRFLFHCYSLEHEDKGMLGLLGVLGGSGP